MSRGHDRERAVRRELEAEGWWVARAAGSLGDADLVASRALFDGVRTAMGAAGNMRLAELRLIEVKSTAGGPYERFTPDKRKALSDAAFLAGAEPWLAYWPPRKPLRWIKESEWPG